MSEKEYIVSLNKGVDYEAFNAEMIASTGAGAIPSRSATVANARPASQRNTHYMLTDEEAEALRLDGRVYGVTLRPDLDPTLEIGFRATQTGNFTKTTEDRGDFINWGLRRMNAPVNPYIGNNVTGGYDYTLDGTGVDIVIQDSGLQADHPDFTDASGVSRVQQIDWFDGYSGGGSMPADHYTDYDGHGTHCGGIAAGKTYGWAKNARIYVVKVNGLQGTLDPNSGIAVSDCFDIIKEWHASKPVDDTGVKRPTIVNMSWGYNRYYNTVTNLTYRGQLYTGTDIDTSAKRWNYGLVALSGASAGFNYKTNVRVASVDTDIEELIDAGVHVVIAAGNNYHKIDVDGGDDFSNFIAADTGSVEYNKGSSPYSERALNVGNIDSSIDAGGLERAAESSEKGPGVDCWAPGTDIMSTTSNTNKFTDGPYPADENFRICNITGTSMAAPQIAGMMSLWLQLNPSATPAQAKAFVQSSAKEDQIFTTNLDNDYTNTRSLLGSGNRFGFNKFNSAVKLRLGASAASGGAYVAPTYTLSSSSPSVNEGSSVTVTLTTTNIEDGTEVGYTVSGVSSADIGASLTGVFTINNNTASKVFSLVADASTEGAETMTVSLDGIAQSVSITVNDTSQTPAAPTYSATPSTTNVNEGTALTINVNTTSVNNGTTLYWTVSSAADFDTTSGSFQINSNTGSFNVTPAEDALTEGSETFTVAIRTGSTSGTVVATTTNITISDTSTTPAGTVYNVTVASGTNQYGTGNKYYIEGFSGASPALNLIEGETYIFRQDDASNATHQLLFSSTANGTWGGGVEYTQGVTKVGTAGSLGAYTQIVVPVSAPTLYYYCINHDGMGGTANTPSPATPTYDSVTSPATVNEGQSVEFTVTTQNVPDSTTVGYTITGISADDLSAGSLTGNIVITANTGSVSVTLAEDATTEGSEIMTLTLDATDSAANTTGAISSSTTITDTSQTPVATYNATPAATNIDEGSALTINVATANVPDATTLYWTVTNTGDFGTASGSFVINSNAGSFTVTPTADLITEGAETFTVSIRTDSVSGTIVDTTSNITINDTSTFTPDYTITVTNTGNSYNLSGTDRNGAVSGSQPFLNFNSGDRVRFSVNGTTSSQHPFYIKTTQSTGTGNQVAGATGQGTTSVDWDTSIDGAGSYGYQCSIHFSMWNTITIT